MSTKIHNISSQIPIGNFANVRIAQAHAAQLVRNQRQSAAVFKPVDIAVHAVKIRPERNAVDSADFDEMRDMPYHIVEFGSAFIGQLSVIKIDADYTALF